MRSDLVLGERSRGLWGGGRRGQRFGTLEDLAGAGEKVQGGGGGMAVAIGREIFKRSGRLL